MKIVRTIDLPEISKFIFWVEDRVKNYDAFSVPRFTIGPNATSMMLWHMADSYDPGGNTMKTLEQIVEQMKPEDDLELKEAIITVAGFGQNNKEFVARNYLDYTCRRTHLIIKGSGTLTATNTITPHEGLIFEVLPEDIDVYNIMRGIADGFTIHVIVFWAPIGSPAAWRMRADYRAKNAKE